MEVRRTELRKNLSNLSNEAFCGSNSDKWTRKFDADDVARFLSPLHDRRRNAGKRYRLEVAARVVRTAEIRSKLGDHLLFHWQTGLGVMSLPHLGYQDIVMKALDMLTAGLRDFVREQLEQSLGTDWYDTVRGSFRNDRNLDELSTNIAEWDAHALLTVMWDHWNVVFRRRLGLFERSLVAELRAFRNRWAHQRQFNFDDTYRFLDSVNRLLSAIGARHAADLSELKFELLKDEFAETLNAESLEEDNRRDRWVVSGVYAACGTVFVTLIPFAFGQRTWPLSVGFALAFGYLIYKRLKWKPLQVGPHECRRCRRIIYGTTCPYCADPPVFDSAEFRMSELDSELAESSRRALPR